MQNKVPYIYTTLQSVLTLLTHISSLEKSSLGNDDEKEKGNHFVAWVQSFISSENIFYVCMHAYPC